MKWFLKFFDAALIITVAILAILFSVADFFNVASGDGVLSRIFNQEFFEGIDVQKSILVLLSLIGIRICFIPTEYRPATTSPEEALTKALADYDGTYLTEFSDAVEMERYLATSIQRAKKSVKDLSWKEKISDQHDLPQRKKTRKSYEAELGRASANIEYQEIFVFTEPRRVEQFERRISVNRPGYSCSYFRNPGDIPRMQFVIVDDIEIIFASSSYPKLCAIRGDALGKIFARYFDDAWERAIPIKKGASIDESEVKYIREIIGPELLPHPEEPRQIEKKI